MHTRPGTFRKSHNTQSRKLRPFDSERIEDATKGPNRVTIAHADSDCGPESMRLLFKVIIAAAVIGLFVSQLYAAPAGVAAGQNSPTFKQLIQGQPDGGLFGAACPPGQFYSCWVEPYGRRFCGCWQGGDRPACPSGYYYTCRIAPDGRRTCACY
jgi:hypothetical protein